MHKKFINRLIPAAIALPLAMPAWFVYGQYKRNMSAAYRRISGGKLIKTACGLIHYAEFGEGTPRLIVRGAGGGYDQGEYIAKLIGGKYRWTTRKRRFWNSRKNITIIRK